ncbi:hypothetical protein DES44_2835 [Roseateles depolymerans]|uniref:N-linked glycosylation glycosyltransferase PglG n=2 Tax=Roseateles depolymerans TaxID=76731 RepID=A0A0U3DXW0_9BURK|nr:hypothetical protein [Roseateles depolymerans]ALV05637.1 N-linked glycosylation glycosyltransferase PglG [Roseateles depolymerans]REG14344.1 hypothetical protein DES44_2835 [Roseateles depolymerans]
MTAAEGASSPPRNTRQAADAAPGRRLTKRPSDTDDSDGAPAFLRGFSVVHALLALLFICMALLLLFIAAKGTWEVLSTDLNEHAAQLVIESMGVLAAAVVALQIAQTITEEEVIRTAHISAPTRVRRFLSRFMVVIVVALAIEGLVATFRASHEGATLLLHAAAMVTAVGVLMGGWGLFIRLNRYAEELEPEAMEDAKQEDEKLKED